MQPSGVSARLLPGPPASAARSHLARQLSSFLRGREEEERGDEMSDETDEVLIRVSISRPSVGIHFISPLLPLPQDAGVASQHALLRGLFNNVVGETKQERETISWRCWSPLSDIYPEQGPLMCVCWFGGPLPC